MRADFHDGREQTFPSKGRIQMSKTKNLQIIKSDLHRTAGPYKWVIFARFHALRDVGYPPKRPRYRPHPTVRVLGETTHSPRRPVFIHAINLKARFCRRRRTLRQASSHVPFGNKGIVKTLSDLATSPSCPHQSRCRSRMAGACWGT
jgi:hypothetical protein